MCEPSPGTSPKARTSKTPPSDSFCLRSALISATIARAGLGVQAAHRRLVDVREVRRRQVVATRRADRRDLQHVGEDLDAERAQELLGDGAAGDARGGLAGAGALEDVAHVAEPVLLRADQVGVAGPRQVHLGRLGLDRPRDSSALPSWRSRGCGPGCAIGPPSVRPWRTPAGDVGAVGLDLHAAAAAMAELAAREVAVERLALELQAGWQALDDAGESGAVRLAGRDQLQRHGPSLGYVADSQRWPDEQGHDAAEGQERSQRDLVLRPR